MRESMVNACSTARASQTIPSCDSKHRLLQMCVCVFALSHNKLRCLNIAHRLNQSHNASDQQESGRKKASFAPCLRELVASCNMQQHIQNSGELRLRLTALSACSSLYRLLARSLALARFCLWRVCERRSLRVGLIAATILACLNLWKAPLLDAAALPPIAHKSPPPIAFGAAPDILTQCVPVQVVVSFYALSL